MQVVVTFNTTNLRVLIYCKMGYTLRQDVAIDGVGQGHAEYLLKC